MKAKKSFGQHFLINESLAESIVNTMIVEAKGMPIVEVGPGKGVLTKFLIGEKIKFTAVDADRDMIGYLKEKYPEIGESFVLKNFLKFDLSQWKEVAVLGNFPYNISSQIVFKIIENKEIVPVALGMFQKEVADRIAARHGNKTYGVISILTQVFYDVKIVYNVSPGSFSPPPKVNSAVVLFKRKEKIELSVSYSLLKSVVKVSFGQRRKMLRNTLKGFARDDAFLKAEIFTKRPEQLSVSQFIDLAKQIENHQKKYT